jgi:hypothetical protein
MRGVPGEDWVAEVVLAAVAVALDVRSVVVEPVAPHPADMTTTHATAAAHPINRLAHTVRRR